MHAVSFSGPQAASAKYDLIAALGCHALHAPRQERLTLRLITLITARYNWRRSELTVGQREIALLWGVSERTAKREMAKLRALGWLTQKRAAARGRVACHALNAEAILVATAPDWPALGPDFETRLAAQTAGSTGTRVVHVNFQAQDDPPETASSDDHQPANSPWRDLRSRLRAEDQAVFANWFAHLVFVECAHGVLRVAAPNTYVARYIETHLAGTILRVGVATFGRLEKLVIDVA